MVYLSSFLLDEAKAKGKFSSFNKKTFSFDKVTKPLGDFFGYDYQLYEYSDIKAIAKINEETIEETIASSFTFVGTVNGTMLYVLV